MANDSTAAEWVPVPGWEAFSWLRAGFSTRQGGVSTAYGSATLNLGGTQNDPPENTAENRRRFLDAVQQAGSTLPLVTLRQVHGRAIVDLEDMGTDGKRLAASPRALMTTDGKAWIEGDGLVTRTPNIWLGAITADCTPVLLVDLRQRAVGSFHAGWRGTVAGIVRDGVQRMVTNYGSRVDDLRAAIGPCICACCFEVGPEVVQQFEAAFGQAAASLVSCSLEGRASIDLQRANRLWLERAGVRPEAITTVEECSACARTATGERRYFSHRAEKGITGRMLSVICARA